MRTDAELVKERGRYGPIRVNGEVWADLIDAIAASRAYERTPRFDVLGNVAILGHTIEPAQVKRLQRLPPFEQRR